jgi:hypothetical protein
VAQLEVAAIMAVAAVHLLEPLQTERLPPMEVVQLHQLAAGMAVQVNHHPLLAMAQLEQSQAAAAVVHIELSLVQAPAAMALTVKYKLLMFQCPYPPPPA